MKALLLHCRNYRMKVGLLATRPENVKPEEVSEPEQKDTDCITALVTIEKDDTSAKIKSIETDIRKMAKDTGKKHVVILPFAHLSHEIAESDRAIALLDELKDSLAVDFKVQRGHFGSHKEFTLDVFGHPGNVRFREY